MKDNYSTLILPDVRQWAQEGDRHSMTELCRVLHPAVVAGILEELESAEVWAVLENADLPVRAEVFEFFDLPFQVELVESLDKARLSSLLEEMSADDRVDLLSRMPQERVDDLLPLLAQAERNDIRRLLSYSEGSAGSIMTTEYASLTESLTVREALDQLRVQAPDSETIYYIYIVNKDRRLDGMVSLRELILAKPDTRLSEIMKRDVVHLRVDDSAEDVAQEMARFDVLALPIVDTDGRLVGIVTHDDALDVVQEEATEDAYRQGAVEPLRDDYEDTPVLTILWKRGIWLLVLSFVAIMTAGVLGYYEKAVLEGGARSGEGPLDLTPKLILLFLPLVMASGGNAGSQSATLFIRMIALQPQDSAYPGSGFQFNRRLAFRELAVAAMLGASMALLDMVIVWIGFRMDLYRSLVVGLTVFLIVILGTTAGTLLPVTFRRLGMDPAIMSNPLIAAIVDVMGVVIFYEVSLMLL